MEGTFSGVCVCVCKSSLCACVLVCMCVNLMLECEHKSVNDKDIANVTWNAIKPPLHARTLQRGMHIARCVDERSSAGS